MHQSIPAVMTFCPPPLPPPSPQIQDTWLQVKLILRSGEYIEVDFYIDEVNREIKHCIYGKWQT